MSNRYKGSIMSPTAATNTTSAAIGIWRSNDIMQGLSASAWPVIGYLVIETFTNSGSWKCPATVTTVDYVVIGGGGGGGGADGQGGPGVPATGRPRLCAGSKTAESVEHRRRLAAE